MLEIWDFKDSVSGYPLSRQKKMDREDTQIKQESHA